MKNGDRIRGMSDPELADFMLQCERQEIEFCEGGECVDKSCDDCMIRWLDTDPDVYKEDPDTFETVLKTVDLLFPGESMYHRTTLAAEVYKKIRRKG